MPTLPDSTALGERPVPQGAGSVSAYAPTNGLREAGAVISGAGRELAGAAEIVAATNERQDMLVAQSAGNALQQARINVEFDPAGGFRNVKEGGAVGQQFVSTYTQKFKDSQVTLRDGLANDNQKRIFDQHAAVQALSFKSALLQHQAQQTEAFNDSTSNASVDLALRTMAQRPGDELTFQMGLAQINGTVEQAGQRKGMSPEVIAASKAKMLDAAYTTRITSVMDGIPGVAPANPYRAEQMFKQVQDQLGPAAQVHLASQVQKAVQSVQARDTAKGFVFGDKAPLAPSAIAPAVTGKPLAAVVDGMESGGRDFAADGSILTSPVGAQGRMQVMPATSSNPGFGVTPAKDGSPEELARVGRDYLGAMSARYNDPMLVMAAYNAGPGQVDKWLAKFGDPRTGQITSAEWADKIPFAETKDYVAKGLQKLGPAAGAARAPTANELKVDLYTRVQAARQTAEEQYPGDAAYADSVASRVENYGRTVIANQQGVEAGARDGLFRGIVGNQPNGSDKPTTIDQLLTDPQQKANWDKATPETRMAVQNHFKNGASDPPRNADSQALLYQFMGEFSNDRESFAARDLSPLITRLPHADFDRLATMQVQARNKQDLEADKATNLQHALSLSTSFVLKPLGIETPTKSTSADKRAAYDKFTGALMQQLDQYQQLNKKRPNDQEIVTMAKNLTATVQVPGYWWGKNDVHLFEVGAEQQRNVTAEVPADFRSGISAAITARTNAPATEAQIQAAYLAHLRNVPKVTR
jgi:soluble lytic murein transglycosylase